jgi:hypothetical protein
MAAPLDQRLSGPSVVQRRGSSDPRNAARAGGPGIVLAVRKDAAARALGISDESFDRFVRPSLPVVRVGSVRIYPVALLDRWLVENAVAPADELAEALR